VKVPVGVIEAVEEGNGVQVGKGVSGSGAVRVGGGAVQVGLGRGVAVGRAVCQRAKLTMPQPAQ
jgi:hypothetical protein